MSIVYPEPFQAFRFLVEVEGGGIVAAFSYFSGIKMQVKTVEGRSGDDIRGVPDVVPVLTEFDPVTLTRGVVGDNDFLDWLFQAAASEHKGPAGGSGLFRKIDIVALDDRGKRGVTWTLIDAMPIGYELTPMDGGRSGVLSESLTFTIGGMARKTTEPSASS